jgi:hypothetical protein
MASSRNCTVTEGFKNVSPVPDTLPVAPPKTCPTVKQYKCMPFDQLRDVHGDYVKMSDGTCLDDIIKDGKTPSSDSTSSSDSSSDSSSSSLSSPNHPSSGLSVAEMEEIVGGVLAGTLVLIAVIWGVSKFSNSN